MIMQLYFTFSHIYLRTRIHCIVSSALCHHYLHLLRESSLKVCFIRPLSTTHRRYIYCLRTVPCLIVPLRLGTVTDADQVYRSLLSE